MKAIFKVFVVIFSLAVLFPQCDKEPEPGDKEPECAIKCDVSTEEYSIEITCESGSIITEYHDQSTEYEYDPSNGQTIGIKINLNQSRTYENTMNTYQIVGVINVNLRQNTVTHNITVSGGVFNAPQTCN